MTLQTNRFLDQSAFVWARLLACLSLALSIGCDHEPDNLKPGAPVSISILSAGQPVTAGQVDLSGQGGGTVLDAQGLASFTHVPYGTYRVIVLPPEQDPVPPEPGAAAPPTAAPAKAMAKFRDEKTTPLSITVAQDSENVFKFDLQESP